MISSCCRFYHSTIGKKWIVAITGAMMIGFLVGHMAGNLQIFEGRGATIEATKINQYAAFLKKEMMVLWLVRLILLSAVIAHVVTTIQLVRINKKARPVGYVQRDTYSSVASRMMFYGGLTLFLYIIYHILHFTTGTVHPELYEPHDVYSNMVRSFQVWWISLIYIVAQAALFMHLYHGAVSLFQTMGVTNPRHLSVIKKGGIGLAVIICGGFISIPVAVLAGWVQ
jgi:succinate dehydrogenase / fumarate reductase cytochrome b subunit